MIAASIIVAIAISVFHNVNLWGLSISNILIVFLVMCLGWKCGMLVGATSGVSIGLALTLIGNFTTLQLLVFAVAGVLAGVLSKFGKIGVIIRICTWERNTHIFINWKFEHDNLF
jgi:L-cysteine desulfidase